ncbi:MAG: PorT family protein [Prevotellaceae bacterium]|jgi:hypothetical protein|nr:PorT family protein [Prevotellaceae bacterium]
MKIKSIFVFASAVIFSANIFAQTAANKSLTFSYEAGYVNQLRSGKDLAKLNNIQGLRMGALVKYSFTNHVFGQTGLLYEYLHYKTVQQYPSAANYRQSTSANQLNLPVLAGYQLPLFSGVKFFAYGGPTLRFGISENLMTATTLPSDSTARANLVALLTEQGLYRADGFTDMYGDKQLARFSVLLTLGGGFEWKKFYLKSGYDFGLTNINAADKKRMTQNGWFISLGYNF